MSTALEVETEWLRSLPSNERARFLAWLSHNLTVAARVLKHNSGATELRLEQLYQLSEIQHRVSSYIGHALGTDEDTWWLLGVAARVFEADDPGVRHEAVWAWESTRKNFVSAT
jgi:hypothetical protein